VEQLAALDHGEARTLQHVADTILHDLIEFTGKNPEVHRLALATRVAELVTVGEGLDQRIERRETQRALEGELREQAMTGHGKPPYCRNWHGQREGRGVPGHRTAKRPACRAAGEPI